jgi:hypothetical protein
MSLSDFRLPHKMHPVPHHLAQDASQSFFTSNPLISLMFFLPHNLAQDKTPMIIMCTHTHTQETIEQQWRRTGAKLCGKYQTAAVKNC